MDSDLAHLLDRVRARCRVTLSAVLRTSVAVIPVAAASGQATFTVHGFGYPSDLSEDASTVIGRDLATGPFVWTAALGQTSIGGYRANAVSDDGQVVAGSVPFGIYAEPAIWTPAGGWSDIGPFPWMSQPGGGQAYGVSGDGAHVVGQAHDGATGNLPFVWTLAGGMVALDPPPGAPHPHGYAIDVSQDGEWIVGVVGGEMVLWDAQRVAHPFRHGLPNLGPAPSPISISSAGDRVTALGVSIGGIVWDRASGAIALDGPGPCCSGGIPFAETGGSLAELDRAGSVGIGNWTWSPTLFAIETTGTIWTPTGGVRLLSDELERLGADLLGFEIRSATALGLGGRLVLGSGLRPGMVTSEWFLATLPLEVGAQACVPAAANSTGARATLIASGSEWLMDGDLSLVACDLPPASFGLALSSMLLTTATVPPSSQGRICLGGPIGRHLDTVRNAGQAGALTIPLDLAHLPHPALGATAAQVGETWHFQVWYRDTNPLPVSNFTGAVSVTVR